MTDNKPFAYGDLKILLQYMDPNKRVEAALRIPSIRTAHKNVPLRVDKLDLKTLSTKMNETEYKLGVYQQYFNQSETPLSVRMNNEDGGFQGDIDVYGFQIFSDKTAPTPGDLDFRRLEAFPVGPVGNEEPDEDREELLRDLLEHTPIDDESPISKIRFVDSLKVELQMLHFKRNGIPLPYKQYFQLTIRNQGRVRIERVESSGKQLRDAMKYINTILFGGKQQVIFVNELSFPSKKQIYYLPENFKVKVKNLGILVRDLQSVKESNAFVESCFPLAKLTLRIENNLHVEELDNDIIRDADALNILHYPRVDPLLILPIVRNKRIHIQFVCSRQQHNYVPLIENWRESGTPVGPIISLGVSKQTDAEQLLRLISNQFEVVSRSRRSITIPMQHEQNVLKIFFEAAKPTDQVLDCLHEGFKFAFIVKMEVLEAREQVPTGFFARGLEMLGALRCPFGERR